MEKETRKIILKEFEPEKFDGDTPEVLEVRRTAPQSFYFGQPVTATPGEAVEVPEKVAILALESGKFEYAPETIEQAEAQVAEAKGELPANFPAKDELTAAADPITTVEDLHNASDEELLAKEGIGPKTLKKIRQAEKEGEK